MRSQPFHPATNCMILIAMLMHATTPLVNSQDRDITLTVEIPVDLQKPPLVRAFPDVVEPAWVPVLTDVEAAMAVLDEARWLFGAMIHGFDYVYTPSDRVRAIADLFAISPRNQRAWPVIMPTVKSVRLDNLVLIAWVEYLLPPWERTELAAWSSSLYKSAQGRGSALAHDHGWAATDPSGQPASSAVLARRSAISDACREALRDYLRGVEQNKPREVRGTFALAAPPRLILQAGRWVATVRLRASVTEIIKYGGY
jgi:hypothetical protein